MMKNDEDGFVGISREKLERVRAVMLRLYTENRLDGDTMRNLAQSLEVVLDEAFPIETNPEVK